METGSIKYSHTPLRKKSLNSICGNNSLRSLHQYISCCFSKLILHDYYIPLNYSHHVRSLARNTGAPSACDIYIDAHVHAYTLTLCSQPAPTFAHTRTHGSTNYIHPPIPIHLLYPSNTHWHFNNPKTPYTHTLTPTHDTQTQIPYTHHSHHHMPLHTRIRTRTYTRAHTRIALV